MVNAQTATTADEVVDFYVLEDEHHGESDGGTMLGFWIYLMSDCLIFAVLFACFGVYGRSYAAGPSGADLFDLNLVAIATTMLLLSSLTFGMAMIAMQNARQKAMTAWLGITLVLGLIFLGLELYEFHHLIEIGAGPQRSAFLSAFFTLVGTHGLHVLFGCIWLTVLLVQVGQRGLIAANRRRLMCLSMFWHFLDVVWIGVFSFVYLIGSLS
ncbi:cytochrome o ubiquinol oxidase subunit III [Aureimonas sp. OT7]|uniref:Cytochrome bo(3) ubiquinol oxidase subunit 3 n=1 Tax=Aureimonas altamirensis TaxID=370622 RepID=A0A0B1Q6T8_9HYPH|nr:MULTISPECIES: cytochrome o ubiquinol oxidase subunit III [Aureimonas]KHJ56099.1 cytochrome o ubiquinol oxidase subunit III [Aureimonas altamirensis]QOG08254.1 cytochrome o ubiquinol oxidase subunit III [Aureimonas sp. OT7]